MELASFSERVLLNSENLTDFEESFAKYALASPDDVAAQTITSLAQRFFVSPNAIVRLSRKLGYAGFADMRAMLGRELEGGDSARETETGDSHPTSMQLVSRTYELCCDPAREARVARLLAESERVVFFAVGETSYAARSFARVFEEFDHKTQFVTYENQIKREFAHKRGLVLVLLSLSGETEQIIDVATAAREAGVPIVAVTDLHESTLSDMATRTLFCCSPQRHVDGINVTDLTPLYAAMTSLQNTYLSRLGVL